MFLHTIRGFFNNEQRLLCLMLITLITAITVGLDTAIAKSLLITHFGLFLLWQPIFKQEESFSTTNLILLFGSTIIFIAWINLWTTTFWVLLLSSLLSGRIMSRGINRAGYGLAIVILFLELSLIITPNLFQISAVHPSTQININIILLLLSIPLLFIPKINISTNVDFIRGFMIVLLTLFLCMGSVIATLTTGVNYIYSLAATIMLAALFLASASFLWAPRAGFSGIAQLWEKYLLNIGGPFEQWIIRLSVLEVNTKIEPDTFLQLCIQSLIERHWVIGIYWKSEFSEETVGETSEYTVHYKDPKLQLTLYSNNMIGPALMFHSKLLLSVLTFYYKSKLQERQLINQAHLRAVYETGSKLTHDVKNVLQSTQNLAQVVTNDGTDTRESHELLKKQLPLLTQRLKSTLDKLTTPNKTDSSTGPLFEWWNSIQNRYSDRSIYFHGDNISSCDIINDVLDGVIENTIENARQKRSLETDIKIDVTLICDDTGFELEVCDSGSPIPGAITKSLFKTILASENGFGIGLYQSYQQAHIAGYELLLKSNETGRVCFLLTNKTT